MHKHQLGGQTQGQTNRQTTERTTSAEKCRVYAMHAMRPKAVKNVSKTSFLRLWQFQATHVACRIHSTDMTYVGLRCACLCVDHNREHALKNG